MNFNPQFFFEQFMKDITADFSVANIQASGEKILAALDEAAKIVEKLAPLVQALAPFAGGSAPAVASAAVAAGVIASATDKAIQDHEAAGGTSASAVAAMAAIAQGVAASGVLDAETAGKINQVTAIVDPAIQAGLAGG